MINSFLLFLSLSPPPVSISQMLWCFLVVYLSSCLLLFLWLNSSFFLSPCLSIYTTLPCLSFQFVLICKHYACNQILISVFLPSLVTQSYLHTIFPKISSFDQTSNTNTWSQISKTTFKKLLQNITKTQFNVFPWCSWHQKPIWKQMIFFLVSYFWDLQ